MPTLDLHPQRDLKLSGEKGKLKDILNIIIQKLSCFVISKMVQVERIFQTLFVILDLRTLSQDISSCIQPKSWKLLRRGSIIRELRFHIFCWAELSEFAALRIPSSLLGTSTLLRVSPALPSSWVLQIEKTGVFGNTVCRDEKLSSFNCMHIVISQAHEITLWNCNYELITGLSNC